MQYYDVTVLQYHKYTIIFSQKEVMKSKNCEEIFEIHIMYIK